MAAATISSGRGEVKPRRFDPPGRARVLSSRAPIRAAVPKPRRRPPSSSPIRLADIAREAGVSTATVSRVINNVSYVSDAIRERVLALVRARDYYPNAHARSLASGRSHLIGLVISDITNPFFPELVKGMETAAFEHGYELLLANTNYDAARMTSYVRRFLERGVRGVAIMTSEFDATLASELARRDVSVVFLDEGAPAPHVSYLAVDYTAGIDEAVAHLSALGHTRVAYVGGPLRMRSASRRLSAFTRSLQRRTRQRPAWIGESDFRLEGGRLAARQMLAAPTRQTAVVVANDMMALGVMQECRAAGLRVPGDISIIGFDDIALAALTDPPLTTVSLSRMTLGRQAVETLVAMLADVTRQGRQIPLTTSLVVRQSTGPAARAAKGAARA
jgi:DNA-binding LacI/PurR family transcriptional regulator